MSEEQPKKLKKIKKKKIKRKISHAAKAPAGDLSAELSKMTAAETESSATHDDIISASLNDDFDFDDELLEDLDNRQTPPSLMPESTTSPQGQTETPIMQEEAPIVKKEAPKPDIDPHYEREILMQLKTSEKALYLAHKNFKLSLNTMLEEYAKSPVKFKLKPDDLLPRYRPKIGGVINADIIVGWDVLIKLCPNDIISINPKSDDNEILDVAETITHNESLQLALVSYVEIMIEMEECEINFEEMRLIRERKKLENEILEIKRQKLARMRLYIDKIKKKNFPVDAEKLVKNYFNASEKDPENAFKVLITTPAVYAPIDFSKIKSKLFGLIKVKPKDGIKINKKIGKFLKRLKA